MGALALEFAVRREAFRRGDQRRLPPTTSSLLCSSVARMNEQLGALPAVDQKNMCDLRARRRPRRHGGGIFWKNGPSKSEAPAVAVFMFLSSGGVEVGGV